MNSSSQMSGFKELSETLGYTVKPTDLFLRAFRHSSYVNEQADSNLEDNERLEFLGDAVLDLAISHLLMRLFQDADEGALSKYRAMVVNEAQLSQVALKLRLGDYLIMGKGEEQSRGREKASILADAIEALLGAIYLDAGFDRTMEIIRRLFEPILRKVHIQEMALDFKSLLQEYTQQTFKVLPKYQLVNESGPAHDKTFKVVLTLNEKTLAEGEGKTKKAAEQMAAREAFACLKRNQAP
ncbi:MAG: ribonuclease III [Thermodesulfobacteriota bacterium]|nr:ribonuclease III [Thermodesulfobacteriota bacterium]